MTEYTFTFEPSEENKFRRTLSRLDEDEYKIIEEIKSVDEKDPRYSDKKCVIEMDSEACLTIRMAMGNSVKIRRKRTEEEEAAEKELNDRHKVTIRVQVPTGNTP